MGLVKNSTGLYQQGNERNIKENAKYSLEAVKGLLMTKEHLNGLSFPLFLERT